MRRLLPTVLIDQPREARAVRPEQALGDHDGSEGFEHVGVLRILGSDLLPTLTSIGR